MARHAVDVIYYNSKFLIETRLLGTFDSEAEAKKVAALYEERFKTSLVHGMNRFVGEALAEGGKVRTYELSDSPEGDLPVLVYIGYLKTDKDHLLAMVCEPYDGRRIFDDYTAAFFNPHTGNEDFNSLLGGEIPEPTVVLKAIAAPDEVFSCDLKPQIPTLDSVRAKTPMLVSRNLKALKKALVESKQTD